MAAAGTGTGQSTTVRIIFLLHFFDIFPWYSVHNGCRASKEKIHYGSTDHGEPRPLNTVPLTQV